MTVQASTIQIYQDTNGKTALEVKLDQETVWLTQQQLAQLFGVNVPAISKHVSNIFATGELDPSSAVSKMERVQSEGKRPVKRLYTFYNLDMIISVGYRVNSSMATKFRVWATQTLKDHLVKGYTVNQQRLQEQTEKLEDLRKTVTLLEQTVARQEIGLDEAKGLLSVITDYAYALTTLDRYDHGTLAIGSTTQATDYLLEYSEAIGIVASMKGEFGGLFGLEKDDGFKSALATIYQTFGAKELYPSVEEKAANLLYFVVKNHAFSDGNKRIAAALFVYFLGGCGTLYRPDGGKRLADNALVALTLLIAESRPEEKDTIVKVVVNLINRDN
jgi:prophage antirepressor-like protein